MTRSCRIKWVQARATECLDNGELALAVATMSSDLARFPETKSNPMAMTLILSTVEWPLQKEKVKAFIERFK